MFLLENHCRELHFLPGLKNHACRDLCKAPLPHHQRIPELSDLWIYLNAPVGNNFGHIKLIYNRDFFRVELMNSLRIFLYWDFSNGNKVKSNIWVVPLMCAGNAYAVIPFPAKCSISGINVWARNPSYMSRMFLPHFPLFTVSWIIYLT